MPQATAGSSFKEEIAEVWKLFKETNLRMQDTDRRMQDTDRRMKETDHRMRETDRQIKELKKSLRDAKSLFTGQWGALIESLVEGNLLKLLQARGLDVEGTAQNNIGTLHYRDESGKECVRKCEVDLIAKNGTDVVAVEVKTTLDRGDVRRFLKVLEYFKGYFPEYSGKRIYGAMAFLKRQGEVVSYAVDAGLFVIRATGDSAYIVNEEDFKPRAFN